MSPRTAGRNDRTSNGRRIRLDEATITSAAVELFNRQGYHATSIQQLADELGCTKAALYYHVDSKADILARIHQTFMRTAWDRIRSRVDAQSIENDPVATAREFVRAAVETVMTHRDYVRVFYQEWRGGDSEETAELSRQRAEYEGMVQRTIESAQAAGTFGTRVDAGTATRFFFGAINWTYMWLDPARPGVDPEDLVEDFLELALYGLVGRDGVRDPG